MIKGFSSPGISPVKDTRGVPFNITAKPNFGRMYGAPIRDLDAETIINRMTNIDRGREYLIYDLIVNLKRDLGIKNMTDAFDCFYMFAADSRTNALLNWAQPQYDCTESGINNFTPYLGMSTNGSSSYINTNFNPTAAAATANFVLNSASFGLYITQLGTNAASVYVMGIKDASNGSYFLKGTTTIFNFAINGSSATQGAGRPMLNVGLIGANRPDASRHLFTRSGHFNVSGGGTTAPTAITNLNFYILSVNLNGSPSTFLDGTVGFSWIGNNLVDPLILNKRIQEYMQQLGIAIYNY